MIFTTIDGEKVRIIDGDIEKKQVVMIPVGKKDIIIAAFEHLIDTDDNTIAKNIINAKLRNKLI